MGHCSALIKMLRPCPQLLTGFLCLGSEFFRHDNFSQTSTLLEEIGWDSDGILLDLGFSQVEDEDRGFSFSVLGLWTCAWIAAKLLQRQKLSTVRAEELKKSSANLAKKQQVPGSRDVRARVWAD
jgi:hypothetical protein